MFKVRITIYAASCKNKIYGNLWLFNLKFSECEEYGELVTHKTSFISLDINPAVNSIQFQECEFVQSTGLIVGGEVTKAGEFPHMVKII